jgi:Protein of unknown function (DUF2637)
MSTLRRITDGVLFQAVLTGALSFSHIHDLAATHGQSGWKAWLYPLSVDLLTVAAYRKLTHARTISAPVGLAWVSFLLGLAASLAANVAGSWPDPDRLVSVSLGVWPAVAFLVCTLLSHDHTPVPSPAPTVVAVAVPDPVAVVPPVPVSDLVPVPGAVDPEPVEVPALAPELPAEPLAPAPDLDGVSPVFLTWAKSVAADYQENHGSPIDLGTLRTRLRVAEPLARAIHHHILTPDMNGA